MASPKDYLSPRWCLSDAFIKSGGATNAQGTEAQSVVANVLFEPVPATVYSEDYALYFTPDSVNILLLPETAAAEAFMARFG